MWNVIEYGDFGSIEKEEYRRELSCMVGSVRRLVDSWYAEIGKPLHIEKEFQNKQSAKKWVVRNIEKD
jgi:hypothetical protein